MNQEPTMTPEDVRLRERLREAVRGDETPPFLEARIRARIQAEDQSKTRWFGGWAMVGATVALIATLGVSYELGHLRFTAASQNSYVVKLSREVATIMRVGLSDHLHCAYFRKYPKQPPPMAEFVKDMGPEFAGLIPVIQQHVPPGVRLEMAHRCSYRKRKFVHLALRSNTQLLSLVIAAKADGESFAIEGMLPALVQSGFPVYRASVRKFEIGAFETRDHLVYVVSDLPQQQNMEQMLAMAPDVRSFLDKLERL